MGRETPGETPGETAGETMVARDPAMLALLRRVAHVAPSNANVLITGESGTGKELVAAHLHRCSGRHGRAFVVLNCAAIPDAMLDSELFGHEKAAFAGAIARRVGRFEAASGGTLLLDEVAEMDLRMQAKVLRAVQHREIDRLGGHRPVRVDTRIVATTSRDLQEQVRLGRFRADLLFRLNVVSVRVPPLRERPADLPALAALFADTFARANGLPPRPLTPEALAVLPRHGWPGNVRELENVMHRAVLTETGPAITPASLDIDFLPAASPAAPPPDQHIEVPPAPPRHEHPAAVHTAGRTIEAVEKDMILDTLRQCKGNRGQTAAVLGISIRTLRNKLHDYERAGTPIPRPVVVAAG